MEQALIVGSRASGVVPVDIAAAFLSVEWSWLLDVLDRQAFPDWILNTVRGLPYVTESVIRFGGFRTSAALHVQCGITLRWPIKGFLWAFNLMLFSVLSLRLYLLQCAFLAAVRTTSMLLCMTCVMASFGFSFKCFGISLAKTLALNCVSHADATLSEMNSTALHDASLEVRSMRLYLASRSGRVPLPIAGTLPRRSFDHVEFTSVLWRSGRTTDMSSMSPLPCRCPGTWRRYARLSRHCCVLRPQGSPRSWARRATRLRPSSCLTRGP